MSINSRSRRGLATVAFLLLLCPSWLGALASPAAAWWGTPHARTYSPHGRFTIDTDLLSHSGLSAWAIDRYLAANTPLPPLGAAFLAAERRYGINARYLLAHAMLESGFGTSDIARYAHNLFGYNAYDRDPWRFAARYRSYAKGIDTVARHIREEYLDPHGRWWGGAPTLRGMRYYASLVFRWLDNIPRPPGLPVWPEVLPENTAEEVEARIDRLRGPLQSQIAAYHRQRDQGGERASPC